MQKETKKRKIRTTYALTACKECKRLHRKCEDQRPCSNCLKTNKKCEECPKKEVPTTENKQRKEPKLENTSQIQMKQESKQEPKQSESQTQSFQTKQEDFPFFDFENETSGNVCWICGGESSCHITFCDNCKLKEKETKEEKKLLNTENISSFKDPCVYLPPFPQTKNSLVAYFAPEINNPKDFNPLNFIISHCGETIAEMIGLKPFELCGLQFKEFYIPSIPIKSYHSYGEQLYQTISKSKQNPTLFRVSDFKNCFGKILQCQTTLSVFTDENRKPTFVYISIHSLHLLKEQEIKRLGTSLLPVITNF